MRATIQIHTPTGVFGQAVIAVVGYSPYMHGNQNPALIQEPACTCGLASIISYHTTFGMAPINQSSAAPHITKTIVVVFEARLPCHDLW